MKKILMFAAYASQLLLLPQTNAVNETKKEIIVSKDFEVKNGLQGFDRDLYLMVAKKVAQYSRPEHAVNNIRNLLGISQETLAHKNHNKFEYMVSPELKKQIFQRPMEASKIPLWTNSIARNDIDTLVAIGYSSNLRGNCLMYSRDEGDSWQNTNIFAKEVKYINGKFFAFGTERIKNKKEIDIFKERVDISVSNDGITWTPFFELSKSNGTFFGKSPHSSTFHNPPLPDIDISRKTPYTNVMAYGDGKYIMVTGNGTVLTKTEHGEEWKKNSTAITDFVPLDEKDTKIWEKWSYKTPTLVYYDPEDKRLKDAEIIYARGNFVLKFSYRNKTHFCTSKDGIIWKHVKSDNFSNFIARNLVGGSRGFAYIGEENQLYYSQSGDTWAKVKLPAELDKPGYFNKVIYLDSSFYGNMFIALATYGNYALLGIPAADDIKWSWTKLKISLFGRSIESHNIQYINCVGKKIIIKGQDMCLQDFRAQL
ncbi:MAG: hypothetical protein LBT70_02570 [Holosporaceae bacterium]|jgi:hypothetical protein|nr:hypothetical protein [Holosporaceae bacterium]